ncbi:MAG: hypothetical protein OXH84_02830 [Gammaproteobacteria bacterium]|nr:hypothetical protein [Gammaproteobacteria bacterium]
MQKLIDHTFNYLRFALLGVAIAFVINPYAAYGSPKIDYVTDTDDDGIPDGIPIIQDPCPEEPFQDRYHALCLDAAGVILINFESQIEEAFKRHKDDVFGNTAAIAESIAIMFQWVLARVANQPAATYEEANIMYCKGRHKGQYSASLHSYINDLEEFIQTLNRMKRTAQWFELIYTVLRFKYLVSLMKVIQLALDDLITQYSEAEVYTSFAYNTLCEKKR